ncbi:homoserine kinase [Buchananella felis]|uniref:homoserine kinase n=1 Tax=Buchananella felis TaxID=3231492 RepID=UPI003527FD50
MSIKRATATVEVPATSANLGPGFDSLGLALGVCDRVSVRATVGATRVEVRGQGEGSVSTGEDNLVIKAIRVGLDAAGAPQGGLELVCHNRIPHGRGMGSSSAAVVAGLMLARALTTAPNLPGYDPASEGPLSDASLLALATEFEGHPDNAAPAIYGGATVSWVDGNGQGRCASLPVRADLPLTVLVPGTRLATAKARSVLPDQVSHADAAFNVARAALLTAGLCGVEVDWMEATADRLHQDARAASMPGTVGAVRALRRRGLPAVVSGAGPSVLVFQELDPATRAELERDWEVLTPGIDTQGARIVA